MRDECTIETVLDEVFFFCQLSWIEQCTKVDGNGEVQGGFGVQRGDGWQHGQVSGYYETRTKYY